MDVIIPLINDPPLFKGSLEECNKWIDEQVKEPTFTRDDVLTAEEVEENYTIEQIFEKKLYMLIPFYIFNFEKELPACEKNEEKLKILESKFQQISDRLIELRDSGELTQLEYNTIACLSKDVINQIAKKYKSVSKGVGNIMRGPMIITEARKIYDEGEANGILKHQIESAKTMIFDGISDENIIKYSGISPENLEKLKAEMAKN